MALEVLRPTLLANRVELLTPEGLAEARLGRSGVKGVAFDVDGTLMAHHAGEFEPSVQTTLHTLGEAGLQLFIISNAYGKRVDQLHEIVAESGVEFKGIYTPASVSGDEPPQHYRKPKPDMLFKLMEDTQLAPDELLMVGDQMAKDILSANRAETYSLLLPRRGEGDDWRVRAFQRPVEALVRPLIGLPMQMAQFPDELTRWDAPQGPDGHYFKLAS